MSKKYSVPIWKKINLSVEEAAVYSHLGKIEFVKNCQVNIVLFV
ncbi:excisionase [Thomasclavelia cocleata]|nr:excisionase [Thomasclavelia cocleata]